MSLLDIGASPTLAFLQSLCMEGKGLRCCSAVLVSLTVCFARWWLQAGMWVTKPLTCHEVVWLKECWDGSYCIEWGVSKESCIHKDTAGIRRLGSCCLGALWGIHYSVFIVTGWSVSCAPGFCSSLFQVMGECSGQGKLWGRVDGQIVFLLQQVNSLQESEKVEGGCYCSAL